MTDSHNQNQNYENPQCNQQHNGYQQLQDQQNQQVQNFQYPQFQLNNSPQNNQQNFCDQNDIESQLNEKPNKSGLLENSRIGFIRKVYIILFAQLLITILSTMLSMQVQSFANFQLNNFWLFYVCFAIMIIIEYAVFCYKDVARNVPQNYICLTVFTLCMSYIVSCVCSILGQENDGQHIVFIAAIMTLGVTLALTLYSFFTKTDFTICGGFLFTFLVLLFIFGIFAIFSHNQILNNVYAAFGVLVYSLYIIYDTQLIAGGKKYSLSIDDYVIGALLLYIDVIGLFLELLRLISGR